MSPSANRHNQMDSSLYSKTQLLLWLNSMIGGNTSSIQSLANGSHFCQLLYIFTEKKSSLRRLNWEAKLEHENLGNLKILTTSMAQHKIFKTFDVQKIAKGTYLTILELLQWFRKKMVGMLPFDFTEIKPKAPEDPKKKIVLRKSQGIKATLSEKSCVKEKMQLSVKRNEDHRDKLIEQSQRKSQSATNMARLMESFQKEKKTPPICQTMTPNPIEVLTQQVPLVCDLVKIEEQEHDQELHYKSQLQAQNQRAENCPYPPGETIRSLTPFKQSMLSRAFGQITTVCFSMISQSGQQSAPMSSEMVTSQMDTTLSQSAKR